MGSSLLDVRALPRRARQYGYTFAVSLVAVGAIVSLPGTALSDDPMFALMAPALFIGFLLTVRLTPSQPGTALVVLPAMAMDARFGLAALISVGYVAIVVNLIRGLRGPRVLSTASHAVVAFAGAHLCAQIVPMPVVPTPLVFGVVFVLLRVGLWRLAARFDTTPMQPRIERPELLLSLSLTPIGLLPLGAGDRLGDGALLLALAALLALLFVVRETANLATARAEVEEQRDRLARANALQDDMINLITHELRNPLTLVMSYAQLSRRAAVDQNYDAIPAYLANVERAGRTIQRLMENLLQFSKLEGSEELTTPEPVLIPSIVDEVVADIAPLARQKNQTLKFEPQADLEPALVVPMLLQEALSNLISNAVKYTPDGGEITVWTERGREPRTIILGVRDTGIGLSVEDQGRLFTKFFRSADPRVQRERGTGLGLALTQALVTRIGGTIAVDSQPGQGTTFRLTLPAAPSDQSDDAGGGPSSRAD
jgi:signal transduction histidine kinase